MWPHNIMTTFWLSWNVSPKWKSKKHTASQTGELSFEWFIGGKHRLFMFPLSKRSKKHKRVNYHGLVYWGKGLGWKRSILSLSRPVQSPRKKVDKRFQLGDVCLKEPTSLNHASIGSREPIILGEILPLCKTIEANISDGGAIDRGSRKKVPNIKVSIYFPLWSRCKCLKTIMGNIKRALTITKKGCDQVWWKKEKKTPLHSRFTALHTRPRN